jgi:iron(III) transport system ATP-binding protein
MAFFEMRDVCFSFPKSKEQTVANFSLSLDRGEIVGILGPSGSGKSTILRLIAGLETPRAGTIAVDGKTLCDARTYLTPETRGIGMVFQDYALFPHLTVARNVTFGLHQLSKSERAKRLKDMLALVHLTDFAERYPHELSGGQQQRVALARALAPKPSVLLMDEPFSNLDADLRSRIREELKDILKAERMTCIFVTHDQEDVQAICDRTIRMESNVVHV